MIAFLAAAALSLGATVPPPEVGNPARVSQTIPAPVQIMAIPPELALRIRTEVVDRSPSGEARWQRLVEFIFSKDGLDISYQNDADHIVADVWRTREVNCLSFTLLVVALAREAGLPAYGQYVDEAVSWRSGGDTIIRDRHVNAGVLVDGKRLTADVASDSVTFRKPPRGVPDSTLIGLFYSNRAMAALLHGDLELAGRNIELAQEHAPGVPGILSNSGVLLVRKGEFGAAESVFHEALKISSEDSSLLSNLAALYERQGRDRQAAEVKKRAERVLSDDPFHQFMLAAELERAGDYSGALRLYRRAVRLHPTEPHFHLALARNQLLTGQLQPALRSLAHARRVSRDPDRSRYQAKIDKLSAGADAAQRIRANRQRPDMSDCGPRALSTMTYGLIPSTCSSW